MSVPVLRFKDEAGEDFPEWEATTIGERINEKSAKFNPEKQTDFMKCIELEHLSQNTGELLAYSDTSTSKSIKNKFEKGDVLFGKLRPYLKKYLKAPFAGVCSTEIWVLKGKGIFNEYLFQFVQTEKFITQANISSGSKMPRADWGVVSSAYSYFPCPEEQTKIANFLTAIDEKIHILTQKNDLLTQYKKGVMQQIFSQELRFKDDDGQDFPEWESGALGDAFEYKNGKSFENEVSENGDYFLVTLNSIDITGKLKAEHKRVEKTDFSLRKNDLVMILSDVAHGNFLGLTDIIPSDKYVLNQRIGGLHPKVNLDVRFASLYINFNQKYFKLHGQGSSQLNLSKGDVLDFNLPQPHIKEQTKIAKFLTAIDEKITVTQNQLKAVKQYKQGLLQQMFV